MMSADIDIRSNRALTKEEIIFVEERLGGYIAKTGQIDFLSMVSGEKGSRLVRIVAVGENYPLYGKIVLSNNTIPTHADLKNQLIKQQNVWVQPELLIAINSDIGNKISIGSLKFSISDSVSETSSGSLFSSGIAYRVFMGLNQAQKTGLVPIRQSKKP